jgi:hypothetical protein
VQAGVKKINKTKTMTAEEFFRKKIKDKYPHQEIVTLADNLITAEDGMRWAYEFSQLPQQEISDDQAIRLLQDMNKQPMRFHCVPKEISDEEIFKHSILAMEERYVGGCEQEIDAHFRGAVWYREQLKNKQ